MIEMHNIVKVFKNGNIEVRALDAVSLNIKKGEFVAITGTSGSGKSTLMNIIGCIDTPTEGSYYLDGEDALGHSEDELAAIRNRKIGFVFQKFNLLPKLDALTNVELPLIYRGESRSSSREQAEYLLEKVGLGERMHHRPSQLSGGQQQRVAVARALIGEPQILLADEPTGNLDFRSSVEIMGLFKELNVGGTTLVLITHDREIAEEAQRMVFIRDGRIGEEVA